MKIASDAKSSCRAMFVLGTAFLVVLHLAWQARLVAGAPFPARYDYDEGVYAETASAYAAGGGLYRAIFLSQPPLVIGALAHTFAMFGRSFVSARGAILAFSALWLAALAALSARTTGVRAMPWAVVIAASAPAFVTASHSVQMEAPAEAFAAMSVAMGFAAATDARRSGGSLAGPLWASSGFVGGLAVMTKYSALACFVPLLLIVAKNPKAQRWTSTWHAALLLGGALLGAAATLIWTDSPPAEMWRQTIVFHGAVARANPVDLGRPAGLLATFATANWFIVLLALGSVASFLRVWRRSEENRQMVLPRDGLATLMRRAVVVWSAVEVVALFAWNPVWPHHFVILVTPLTVLAAATVDTVWRGADHAGYGILARTRRLPAALPRLALAVLWLAALATMIPDARPGISQALRALVIRTEMVVPPAAQVVTDDPLVAFLAQRDVPPSLCDTSEMRMRAGWLTVRALRDSLRDPRVRGVVLWRGTFRRFAPAFVDDATSRFPRRWAAASDGLVLAR